MKELMKINGEETSGIYTISSLSELLKTGNFDDEIEDGDYIKLVTEKREYTLIANIDPYLGINTKKHHIDFISKEVLFESCGIKMRYTDSNNGVSDCKSPYLSSDIIIDFLRDFYKKNIPDDLKNHIACKKLDVPYRYMDNSDLTYDNSSGKENLGKLWIPYADEVFGCNQYCCNHDNHIQYACFESVENRAKRSYWWTASAGRKNNSSFCAVDEYGDPVKTWASSEWLAIPLCFRFI